jgi:predicted Zn-ribbon and HTH transcriptional regulator
VDKLSLVPAVEEKIELILDPDQEEVVDEFLLDHWISSLERLGYWVMKQNPKCPNCGHEFDPY